MLQASETFFTVIGCMDGRCQEAVVLFGQDRFAAQYPDTITEAGLVGLLAEKDVDPQLLAAIKKKIDISLKLHHSKGILVYGHAECAGNPVADNIHKEDVSRAVDIVKSLVGHASIPVIPLFVERSMDNDLADWEAHQIISQDENHSN